MHINSIGSRCLILLAGSLILLSSWAGCSSDDDPVAPEGGQPGAGTYGYVAVVTQPEFLNVTWALTQPSGTTVQGRGNALFEDMSAGTYQVSWPVYPGWIPPRPNPRGKDLTSGGIVEFFGNYYPLPGNINIVTNPRGVPAPWVLTFEDGSEILAEGNAILVNMLPGFYQIDWGHVDGMIASQTSQQELTLGEGLLFTGNYQLADDFFFVSSEPADLSAPWGLTGPGGFNESGTGNETVPFTSEGDYTITWGEVAGYQTPPPEVIAVADSNSYQLNATYEPITGSVAIVGTRGTSSLEWTLTGPNGFSLAASGDRDLTGLVSGEYWISWPEMEGWSSPEPSSQVLDPAGSLTFTAIHNPALNINTQPAGLLASWQVTGPGGYSEGGQGPAKLTDLAAGAYSLTWEGFSGWTGPGSQTGSLSADQGIVFEAVFEQVESSIFIAPEPLGVDAPWVLTGPNGFQESGSGQAAVSVTENGEYRLTWGEVEGMGTPGPMVKILFDETGHSFSARYLPSFPMVAVVVVEEFEMGSSNVENCRSFSEEEHIVSLTNNYDFQATEVTNEQYKDLAQWAIDQGYATLESWAIIDALDNSTALLLHMGDGDQDIYIKDGRLACRNPDYPVKKVSWYGAAAYCDWLSLHRGLRRAYSHATWQCNGFAPSGAVGYRLPTEPEWEYAARAGSTTAYPNGDILVVQGQCVAPELDQIAWFSRNADAWSHPVAQLNPNDWGIYDTHGNVQEWCNDYYNATYYAISPGTDPSGPSTGETKVVRGGFFYSPVWDCRSASRGESAPANVSYNVGFRVVKTGG